MTQISTSVQQTMEDVMLMPAALTMTAALHVPVYLKKSVHVSHLTFTFTHITATCLLLLHCYNKLHRTFSIVFFVPLTTCSCVLIRFFAFCFFVADVEKNSKNPAEGRLLTLPLWYDRT